MSLAQLGKLLKAEKIETDAPSGAVRHYLNTGYPPLNEAISGYKDRGLPSGQVVMIGGPSQAGKTVIAAEMMISAQKAGGYAGFFDYETQFQTELSEERGLSTGDNWGYWKPSTFEQGIATAIKVARAIRDGKMIDSDAPIVYVFDSLHSMTPQSKYDNMMDSAIKKGERTTMHDNYALSKATSDWFPVIQREFDRLGVTAIFLNQVRKKTDHMGRESFVFPGGDAPYYYCSTVIILTGINIKEGSGSSLTLVRKEITALVDKSRNTVPFKRCKWNFLMQPRPHFDVIGSYATHLQQLGAIETAGSRVGWKGKSPYLSQVIEELKTEPDTALKELVEVHDSYLAGTVKYPYPKKD